MAENKKISSIPVSIYMPVLMFLLIVAVFFVGRLSSQVEMLGKTGSGVALSDDVDQEVGSPIGVPALKKMADKLSLNQKEFDSCLDEGKYEDRVKSDLAYGSEIGVSATPAFFINSVMILGAQPQEIFETVIDYELAGGSWDNPDEAVSYLVDENPNNGEVTIVGGVETGVGSVMGSGDAKVKIVEFSDFECPYCARVVPTIEAIIKKYGDDISLEYRHFPLSGHANAQKAAEASECASDQGKFWEMHDMIFEVQG
jgi:protein-disulfide isomerase